MKEVLNPWHLSTPPSAEVACKIFSPCNAPSRIFRPGLLNAGTLLTAPWQHDLILLKNWWKDENKRWHLFGWKVYAIKLMKQQEEQAGTKKTWFEWEYNHQGESWKDLELTKPSHHLQSPEEKRHAGNKTSTEPIQVLRHGSDLFVAELLVQFVSFVLLV